LIDFALLIISMSLSSTGSFLDNYTTLIFIRDLGVEFEANKRVRDTIIKHGYKASLLPEAILIIMLGIIDSLKTVLYSFCFFGLVYLIVKGLTATHNLQIIVEYRTIGIDTFKERVRTRKQAFQSASSLNMIKYVLQYLVEAIICFIIYVMLLTVDFPLVILCRYSVFGLAFFFIAMVYYTSQREKQAKA
jgi:hypothetical protein